MPTVSTPTIFRKLLAATVLAPLLVLLWAAPALAHDGQSTVIYFDVYPDGTVEGQVEHPVELLNEVFGFELDADEATEEELAATQDVMLPLNSAGLAIADDNGAWPITFTDTEVVETENRLYAAYNFEIDKVFEDPPRAFELTYTAVFDVVPNHSGFVVIRTDPVTGLFLNEADFQPDLLTSSDPTSSVDLDDPSRAKALTGTIDLGMDHIFIGTDHILFVLVLLLPAVLLFSAEGKWEPVPTFGSGLWRVLKIATMFTIAHSITLTLGGLEIIELPSKLVETIIALSIIAAALHNLRPVFANKEHLIAFAFGIFHGFGFAGLLSDLGVGRGQRVLSLFGFNIGVEIGQAVIILLLFPALFILRRTTIYPSLMRLGSIVLAAVAAIWAIERIFETSLGIDNVVEKFTRTPRAFVLIGAATLAAIAYRRREQSRGRLRGQDAPASREAELAPA